MEKTTKYSQESFIRKSNLIDGKYLDMNQLPAIPNSITDEEFVIPPEFDERPDLLAKKLYGSSRLFWVFSLRNLDIIKDPMRDFKAGVTIMLPSSETVEQITGKQR